jgi:hypothetical protein
MMISNIEEYLINLKDNTINYNIYDDYKKFNYNNKELFKLHLDFLLNNIYIDIKINEYSTAFVDSN